MIRQLVLAASLVGLEIGLRGFWHFDWHAGTLRGVMVVALAMVLVYLPRIYRAFAGFVPTAKQSLPAVVAFLPLVGFGVQDCYLAATAVAHTVQTGEIYMDQGEDTYRAALELLNGRSAYARGELLDLVEYRRRADDRAELGVGPKLPAKEVDTALTEYWRTLDPQLKARLLPEPPAGSPAADREVSMIGYKYGPLRVLMTAALVPVFGPAAVPLMNVVASLALLWVVWLILRRSGVPAVVAALAVAAVAGDAHFQWNYITQTGSDIWPLLFGGCAVLASIAAAPIALGVSLSLALGCKLFPALLYLPLLLHRPKRRAFIAFGIGMAAIYVPWLIWDARGLYFNLIAFLSAREPDSTSWQYFAPPRVAAAARYTLAPLLAVLGLTLAFQSHYGRIALTLSLMSMAVLLASGTFHNNYVPWFGVFSVLAVVGAWQRELDAEASGKQAAPAT